VFTSAARSATMSNSAFHKQCAALAKRLPWLGDEGTFEWNNSLQDVQHHVASFLTARELGALRATGVQAAQQFDQGGIQQQLANVREWVFRALRQRDADSLDFQGILTEQDDWNFTIKIPSIPTGLIYVTLSPNVRPNDTPVKVKVDRKYNNRNKARTEHLDVADDAAAVVKTYFTPQFWQQLRTLPTKVTVTLSWNSGQAYSAELVDAVAAMLLAFNKYRITALRVNVHRHNGSLFGPSDSEVDYADYRMLPQIGGEGKAAHRRRRRRMAEARAAAGGSGPVERYIL
jgi:hypothetical protein